eukprot:3300444-Amphidinium_carterae.1
MVDAEESKQHQLNVRSQPGEVVFDDAFIVAVKVERGGEGRVAWQGEVGNVRTQQGHVELQLQKRCGERVDCVVRERLWCERRGGGESQCCSTRWGDFPIVFPFKWCCTTLPAPLAGAVIAFG